MPDAWITPNTFRFLKQLAAHNERAWFQANKQRYEDDVRDPLLRLVSDFAPKLSGISKNLVADPRPLGGSLFRIHRDTRFAKDKSPYKTHAGLFFRHVDGKELPAPGYYLHVEPGQVFMAAGMWHAQTEALKPIRDAIVGHPERWRRVRAGRSAALDDSDDDLARTPRGYDPEHPFAADLRRRSFTSSVEFTAAQACAPDFLTRFTRACRQKTPLMEFLCHAVGRPW